MEPKFSDILAKVLNGRMLSELPEDEFEEVSKDVIAAHKDAFGITYCVPCHKIVDPQR